MSLNITPLRLSVLRFLSTRDRYNAKRMVEQLCPREGYGGRALAWTEQGLARQTGKVTKAMVDAGLIQTDRRAQMCRMDAWITDAGRALLAEHEQAASQKQLADAIQTGA